ncbi:MAG: DUF3159 domain-containing protein [Bowdeniella nasicola]|nr:DUF3159 domain-containing protein [Bowdeniella nasicola]
MSDEEQRPLRRGSFAAMTGEKFDLLQALGGVQGLIESTVPTLIFLILFGITQQLRLAVIAALAAAAIAVVIRLLQRTPIIQAVAGFAGVMICAAVAAFSGDAGGYFVPGLWINAAYGVVFLVSLLVGWPLIGFIHALIIGTTSTWRTSTLMPRYRFLTALFTALFALRLAVQWPLYATGQVGALGTARLLMGAPLFAAAIFFSWLILRQKTRPADQSYSEG